MNWMHTTLSVGADAPFTALHVSDTHLAYSDERDDTRKAALAQKRYARHFMHEDALASACRYAQKRCLPILHTGDLIDFVSCANLDRAKAFSDENDVFLTAGNHEFCQYMDGTFEDAAYRAQSLAQVQAAFRNDIRFDVRDIGGVRFVGLDNSYYLVEPWQLARLKEAVRAGKPVVLMVHVPLYSPAQFDFIMKLNGNPALMAAPENLTRRYPENLRAQQQADEATREAYDYIVNERGIRAILTGHQHVCLEDSLSGRLTQYLTDCDTVREITFTP